MAPPVWKRKYPAPISRTIVWVEEKVKGIKRTAFVLFLTARTNRKPARFSAGPCGLVMKLTHLARPDWNLASAI